jgi:DivIVA domain-containing protein
VIYVWLVVGVAVVVVVVLVALGRGDSAAPVEADSRAAYLPGDRALTGDDVDALRLPQAVRGYRVRDVDDVLDRLAAELRDRDARLAALTDEVAPAGPGPAAAPATPDEGATPRSAHAVLQVQLPPTVDGVAQPTHAADAVESVDGVDAVDAESADVAPDEDAPDGADRSS